VPLKLGAVFLYITVIYKITGQKFLTTLMDAHQLKVAPIKLLLVSQIHVSVIHTGKDEDSFIAVKMSAIT
jgi:hypothetical protein